MLNVKYTSQSIVQYITVIICLFVGNAYAIDFRSSAWESISNEVGIDPHILYALALKMSPKYDNEGNVYPWPYTIHIPEGPQYYDSKEDAQRALSYFLNGNKYQLIDISIGMLQVNLHYNGNKVENYQDLLDPSINLQTAAKILKVGMNLHPTDIELGIGIYYSNDEKRARNFGNLIINTAAQLIE